VIDSPLNDTGDKLAVSGEFTRIIAAAINVDPRWFFALGRRVMGEDRRGVPGSLRLGCHSDTRKTRRSRPCDAFNEMVVGARRRRSRRSGILGASDHLCGPTARSFPVSR